jgi:hypothetical protein
VLQTKEEMLGKRIRIYYSLNKVGKKTALAKIAEMEDFINSLQIIFQSPNPIQL